MGCRERGATLIEVLVTAALMLVGVLASGSLIVHSVKLDRSVMRTLNDPAAEQAIAWIRRDVHAAAALRTASVLWTAEALELQMFDEVVVRYSQLDGALLRRQLDGEGVELTRRVILERLQDWQWRTPTLDLLEVVLVLPSHGDPVAVATKAGHKQFGEVGARRTEAVFSVRAHGRRSW